jgi:hypothetical protein|tara:strand:- start:141 stop:395 length:255 start_codon:yes stop_codon:yes gene_type:complete
MNTTQKIFLIVGITSFLYWLFIPVSSGVAPFVWQGTNNIGLIDMSDEFHYWYYYWYQLLSFIIAFSSGIGFFLFKDKKAVEEKE